MSEAAVVEEVYSAVEESSRLVGAPCSRERTLPVLTAFADGLAEAGMVLSVSTGATAPEELDYTVTVPTGASDPHAVALAHGLVTRTGHPVDDLLADLEERVRVGEYFIDGGAVSGFSKVYAHFPFDLLGLAHLTAVPSMPPALAAHADLFARHHLNEAAMAGIDYRNRTVNLYFAQLPDGFREEKNVRSLHREIGLPEPDGPMLDFARNSFRVYVTLGWDSPGIKRICYAPTPVRDWDPARLPVRVDAAVERFVRGAPRTYGGAPFVIAAVKWTPAGSYLNLGPYIRLSPLMEKLLTKLTGEQV